MGTSRYVSHPVVLTDRLEENVIEPIQGTPTPTTWVLPVSSQASAAVTPTEDSADGVPGTTPPPVAIQIAGSDGTDLRVLSVDSNGKLNVNTTGGGGNAAAGLTGSAVPTFADYLGVNIAGSLIGVTGIALTNAKAATVAIVDGSGNQITSFGGGTQFADNATSGATPIGTLSMGWDSVNSKIRALKVDASQNLEVSVQNFPTTQPISGTVAVSNFPATQPVSGTVAATQSGTWAVGISAAQTIAVTQPTAANLNATITGTVAVSNFPATQPVSGTVAATQSGTWNIGTVTTITNPVTINTIPVGTNIIGKVGIDQTTPGTTNGVQVNAALPAGTNLIGKTGFDPTTPGTTNGVSNYQAASVTGTITSASGAGSTVSIPTLGAGVVSVYLTGTYAGVTINFEESDDSGTTFFLTSATSASASIQVNTVTLVNNSAVSYDVGAYGTTNIRVRASGYTSGTLNVTLIYSAANIEPASTVGAIVTDGSGNTITSTGAALDVNIKTSSIAIGGGTQFTDGATSTTPTGTVAMGKNPSNIIHAVALDASGNLNVNVQAGGTGGNASVSTTGTAVPASATMIAGSDGTNLRAVKTDTAGVVSTAGALTNNNAAPATNNFGVLPGIANAAPPTFTEGNAVLQSIDLNGSTRMTIRPPAALGFYSIGIGTGVYVGLAAGAALFSARWGDATRLCLILKVTVSVIQSAAVSSTGGRVDRRLIIARGFTGSDSGGTTIVLTGNNQKMRTSQGTSLFTDMRVASTAALSVGTRTLDSQGVGIAATWANLGTSPTALGTAATPTHNRIIDKYDLFNASANFNYPIVLAQNEGIIIDVPTAQPSGSSLSSFVEVVWAEVNAF